ncbi:TetR/AcrR family transcriptional regulator [Zavarzinia compransoris]|uniref:TetR/AcrR family transcriptional regulator n=1 Tax=Zavarzinia marina TaxID=2911065 RepID=UPI001F45F29A|nr:TetR/AcrR family transcriptional regulator [Zavarzinia marina]MCF4167025.1 TetR/AcrR family transcriptional regulator [Zavarzinia marina]
MRYAADHKDRSREKILDAAAHLLRQKGIDGVGLSAIMARAGLTNGAFYAHFPSRDALVADALDAALDFTIGRLRRHAEGFPPEARLRAVVAAYLSPQHCRAPEDGCTFAALGSDLARLPPETRARLHLQYDRMRALLAEGLAALGRPPADAGTMLATMIGTLTLARLAPDETAARAQLDNAIEYLLA